MKAFRFRLDQALRWRAAQVDVAKAQVAGASAELARLGLEEAALHGLIAESAAQLATDAWTDRCRRDRTRLERQAAAASQAMQACMRQLIEANRKVELLRKLKDSEQAEWQAQFGREMESFAGETFLRQVTIKNARARSSVG